MPENELDIQRSDSGDRISRLREALEESKGLRQLYGRRIRSHKPWDGIKAPEGALQQAFPDYEVTVEDAFESGDRVAVRWRLQAINTGDLEEIKATNRPVDITGINIYRFVGNRVVETWGQFDAAALAEQCGKEQGLEVINMLAPLQR